MSERCACCGGVTCMFTETGNARAVRNLSSLYIRNLAPTPAESAARMTRKAERMAEDKMRTTEQEQDLREMQLLFKLRDGGPGFALGYHEERRASVLLEKGWIASTRAVYKTSRDRHDNTITEYRNRYSITEEGKAVLDNHEKRGLRN